RIRARTFGSGNRKVAFDALRIPRPRLAVPSSHRRFRAIRFMGHRKYSEVQHELPPLRLRKKAECGHTVASVPSANLPEQRTIGLQLNLRPSQIGCLRGTASTCAMTRRAPLLK